MKKLLFFILIFFSNFSFAITSERCNSTPDSFIAFAYNQNYSKSYIACFFPYNGFVYYILIDIVYVNSEPYRVNPDFLSYSHLASVPVPYEYPEQAFLNAVLPEPPVTPVSAPVAPASDPVAPASAPASAPVPAVSEPVPAAPLPAVPVSFALAATLPHTSDMNPFPSLESAVSISVSLSAAMLGGIGVAVGAPLFASTFAFSTAVAAAVAALPGVARDFSPDSVFAKSRAPLIVYFTPASSLVSAVSDSAPAGGSSASAAVATASDGRFVPTGAAAATSIDGGGWTSKPNGGASFTPVATPSNPTPVATVEISNWGSSVTQITPSGSSVTVTRSSGGSFVVTNTASIPVVTSSGSATTVQSFVTDTFSSASSTSPSTAPSVAVASVFGDGSANGAGGFSVNGVSGSGVAGTGSAGSGTGAGGCSTGNCATETTQLANSGFLSKIAYFFTSSGEASTLPDSKTGADVKGAGLNKTSASFSQLLGFRLPAHSSVCPVSSFNWSGSTYVFDAHCKLATDNFDVFRATMTAMFSLSALFVVLRA